MAYETVPRDIDGNEVGPGDELEDVLSGERKTVAELKGCGRYYLFADGKNDLTHTPSGSTVYRLVRRADGTEPGHKPLNAVAKRKQALREKLTAKMRAAEQRDSQISGAQAMLQAEMSRTTALPDDPTPLTMAGRYRQFRDSFETRSREIAPYAVPISDRISVDGEFNVLAELSQGNASVHTTIVGALHQPATAGADAAGFLASKLQYELSLVALRSPPATTGSRVVPGRDGMPAEAAGRFRPRFADRGAR